jgi:hypothetical protein
MGEGPGRFTIQPLQQLKIALNLCSCETNYRWYVCLNVSLSLLVFRQESRSFKSNKYWRVGFPPRSRTSDLLVGRKADDAGKQTR